MKNIMLVTLSVFFFASCEKVTGQLEVLKTTTVNSKKDQVTLNVGTNSAELNFKSKRSVTLETQGKKVKIKLNKGTKFPEDGNFSFPVDSLGEDFALEGSVDKNVVYGQVRSSSEVCYESRPYTRCYRDGCRTVYRQVRGYRNIDYRINTITQTSTVDMVQGGEVVAIFNSDNTDTVRDVINYGFCSVGGYGPHPRYPRYPRRRY